MTDLREFMKTFVPGTSGKGKLIQFKVLKDTQEALKRICPPYPGGVKFTEQPDKKLRQALMN
uniref:Uncharacterized protein n=1 Tax=viral metagenome TaxID=1070528 RepID=A0A6M3INV3_9ZZZZ